MKLKLSIMVLISMILIVSADAQQSVPLYKNTAASVDSRVSDLISRMTLEEKAAQLQCIITPLDTDKDPCPYGLGEIGNVLGGKTPRELAERANKIQKYFVEKTRLGIPVIIHCEALHGLCDATGPTSFPQAIGIAATFDDGLMSEISSTIAGQVKTRGFRQVLSPVVNMGRDSRWGRIQETYGEDPYLISKMGVAFCKNFEQEGIITTPKHFAANFGDGGRDSNPVHFSERLLREIYFPAFKACFQDAGSSSVMISYNSIDGRPSSANKWLIKDILKGEWGFQGFVVSDYFSAEQTTYWHNIASNYKDGAKETLEAGLDSELPCVKLYGEHLIDAVKEGSISESTVDESVRRILSAKFKTGLFDNPYVDVNEADKVNDTSANRQLALKAAQKAIVLLKNENGALPFGKNIRSIAVIGKDSDNALLGGYSGSGMKKISVLEGFKNKVPGAKIIHAVGPVPKGLVAIPADYLTPAGGKAGEKGLKGEYFDNMEMQGNPVMVTVDKNFDRYMVQNFAVNSAHEDEYSIRLTGTLIAPVSGKGKIGVWTDDGARLYIDGKLIIDKWENRNCLLQTKPFIMQKGRKYDIRFEYNNIGSQSLMRLMWELPENYSSDISKAVNAAKRADAAVIVASIEEGEGSDRVNLDLPYPQTDLINAVAATGKPTIVVLMNGGAVTMNDWIDSADGIVEAWYPGEEGGNAVADIILGNVCPGGKLPITFPEYVGQEPMYYNTKPSGRANYYIDSKSEDPLFPFGYGLSYTSFEYSGLTITPETIKPAGKFTVSVNVRNTGKIKGDEVVQLYIRDVIASTTQPFKQLKGFKRITLEPGESQTVKFDIKSDDIAILDKNMNQIVEPGLFNIMVGSSSRDIRVKGDLIVKD